MRTKETKTAFIAICTEPNEKETCFDVGDKMGEVSKKTGKFAGATVCMIELRNMYKGFMDNKENEKQKIVDDVISQMKKDFEEGDLTAIDELLKFVPIEFLKGYLPEV